MLAYDHDEDSAADEGDRIPLSGESHRGVPLHAGQSRARLQRVKHDIDRAYELDAAALLDFAENAANAPESRAFACARLLAEHEAAVENRMARPTVDLPRIRAASAGVTSRKWRNPHFYCSDLDAHAEDAVPREEPLDEE